MAAHEQEIAVIGLGTGLTTLAGIDKTDQLRVTGFDSRNRLGGHIHSIKVRYLAHGQAVVVDDKNTPLPKARYLKNGQLVLIKDETSSPPKDEYGNEQQWRDGKIIDSPKIRFLKNGGIVFVENQHTPPPKDDKGKSLKWKNDNIQELDWMDDTIITLEGGAEFIGNPTFYINFHIMCEMLGIPLDKFELNMEFHQVHTDEKGKKTIERTFMPPLFHSDAGYYDKDTAGDIADKYKDKTLSKGCLSTIVGLFKRHRHGDAQPQTKIDFTTVFTDLGDLLNIYNAIQKSLRELKPDAKFISLEKFLQDFINECPDWLCQRQAYVEKVLYPFIAAGWGVSYDMIKQFGAHYAMLYLGAGSQWYDAPHGLSSYIDALGEHITNSEIRLNTEVEHLIPVVTDGKLKFQLQLADGNKVSDKDGKVINYDQAVLATSAEVTSKLLATINTDSIKPLLVTLPPEEQATISEQLACLENLKAKLAAVKYYDTTVVFHQDSDYESEKNTVVHTMKDGEFSANTMCKRGKFPEHACPVMKTWVLPEQNRPKNIIKEVQYRHPVMNKAYYEAQQAIEKVQGILNMNFGGALSGLNDSHESGITVALENAARILQSIGLDPKENPMLKPFFDKGNLHLDNKEPRKYCFGDCPHIDEASCAASSSTQTEPLASASTAAP